MQRSGSDARLRARSHTHTRTHTQTDTYVIMVTLYTGIVSARACVATVRLSLSHTHRQTDRWIDTPTHVPFLSLSLTRPLSFTFFLPPLAPRPLLLLFLFLSLSLSLARSLSLAPSFSVSFSLSLSPPLSLSFSRAILSDSLPLYIYPVVEA